MKLKLVGKWLGLALATVSIGLLVSACSSKQDDNKTAKSEQPQFDRIAQDGSFTVSKKGASATASDKKAIVDVYLDPMCPSCGDLEREMGKYLEEQVEKDNIQVRYHPLMFLDQASGKSHYSTRASAWILGVAQYAPELAQKYVNAIFSKSFQPDEANYQEIPNTKLRDLFLGVGGTKEQASKIMSAQPSLEKITYDTTMGVMRDKELPKHSPTGELYTPFVMINKPGEYTAKALRITDNMLPVIQKSVEEAIK